MKTSFESVAAANASASAPATIVPTMGTRGPRRSADRPASITSGMPTAPATGSSADTLASMPTPAAIDSQRVNSVQYAASTKAEQDQPATSAGVARRRGRALATGAT